MFNKSNYKTYFTAPTGNVFNALSDIQKKGVGSVTEGLGTIVGTSFNHLPPEMAGVIAEKALELNQLIVGSFMGPHWKDTSGY